MTISHWGVFSPFPSLSLSLSEHMQLLAKRKTKNTSVISARNGQKNSHRKSDERSWGTVVTQGDTFLVSVSQGTARLGSLDDHGCRAQGLWGACIASFLCQVKVLGWFLPQPFVSSLSWAISRVEGFRQSVRGRQDTDQTEGIYSPTMPVPAPTLQFLVL